MHEADVQRLLGIVSLTLAITVFFLIPSQVDQQPIPGTGDLVRITPAAIPSICAFAFAILGFFFIARSFFRKGDAPAAPAIPLAALPRLAVVTITLMAYPYLMEAAGYLLTTVLLLLVLNLYFGTRKPWQLAVGAFALPLAIFYFFGRVMLIPLPAGFLLE
jgi:hypothetical protein